MENSVNKLVSEWLNIPADDSRIETEISNLNKAWNRAIESGTELGTFNRKKTPLSGVEMDFLKKRYKITDVAPKPAASVDKTPELTKLNELVKMLKSKETISLTEIETGKILIAQLNSRVEYQNQIVKGLEEDNADMRTRIEAGFYKIGEIDAKKTISETKFSALSASFEMLENDAEELEKEVTELTQIKAVLEKESQEKDSIILALQEKDKHNELLISELKKKLIENWQKLPNM